MHKYSFVCRTIAIESYNSAVYLCSKFITMLDVLLNQPEEKSVPGAVIKVSDRADKPIKSIMKSISWRIVGTIDTMIITYFITGRVTIALSIGSVEVFTKTILYYFHERLWAHIHKISLRRFRRSYRKKYEKQYEVKGVERSVVR
jgi:uncharacterized membrane protein